MAIIMMAAVCLVPMGQADASYSNIQGETNVIEVDESADFNIIYSNQDLATDADISIEYDAKLTNSRGETQSNAVSPSSGSLDNNVSKTLTVDAPKDAGTYTLTVEFVCEVDGDEVDKATQKYTIKVVEPITLTVDLKVAEGSNIDPSGLGVYFWVDGKMIEDSFTTFTVSTKGTATVSYDWIADVSNGEHKFKVVAAEGGITGIEGLGEEHSFYVGEKSYTTYTVLVVVLLIIVIIALIWVYRKPVKNYGKPKARR